MSNILIGIGDIHGHADALETLLHNLDNQYSIFSGRALRSGVKLIALGDEMDRGPQSSKVVRILQRYNLPVLMSNHTLLALAYFPLAKKLLENDAISLYKYQTTPHGLDGGVATIGSFGQPFSKGLQNYVRAMDRGMRKWMLAHESFNIQEIHGKRVLFVHAGVPSSIRSYEALIAYGENVREHLSAEPTDHALHYLGHELVGKRSMFWNRDISDGIASADLICKRLGMDYLVFGHTPHETITRYGSSGFCIDTGMKTPEGISAIIFSEGKICSFSLLGETRLI